MPHPLPVIAGAYYTIVQATADIKPVSNVFCFLKDGVLLGDPSDATFANDVATKVGVNWHNVSDLLQSDYLAFDVKTYPLGSPILPAQISSVSLPGGITTSTGIKQVAALVHHTVTRRGKGSQSRTFLSPLPLAALDTDNENLTNTYHTSLQAGFSAFITDTLADLTTVAGAGWHYVQLSKKLSTTFPISASSVQLPVATIARRLGR